MLRVNDLTVQFGRQRSVSVDHISFTIEPGERVGLIGESGSGKSVTALSIMGLLADTAQVSGSITLDGGELIGLSDREYSKLRGRKVSMVFQEPMTALDPTMLVGRQVAEVIRLHEDQSSGRTRERVCDMLARVDLDDVDRIADSFPHQLSGGQRQRVLIAMALINTPDLLICDEPTTALDVTVQANVLQMLSNTLDDKNSALLFISHDLAVVSKMCDRIMVMYGGRIVEDAPTATILSDAQHPYTRGLIATASIAGCEPGKPLPVLEDFWSPDE